MTTDTTPTHSTLEPCPLCGGEPTPYKLDKHSWRVSCPGFPPNFPVHIVMVGTFDTEAEAIAAWNTRSQPTDRADTAGALEAESAALRDMREAVGCALVDLDFLHRAVAEGDPKKELLVRTLDTRERLARALTKDQGKPSIRGKA